MAEPTLDALSLAKHSVAPEVLRRLGTEDLRRLRERVLRPQRGVSRMQALRWLLYADPVRARDVFRQIMRNAAEDESVRATAADFATRLADSDGELAGELIQLAGTLRSPASLARLSKVLGRTGGGTAREPLSRLAGDKTESVRRCAVRAQDLLRQRLGEEADDQFRFEPASSAPATMLSVDAAQQSAAPQVIDHVRGFIWGAVFSPTNAARWTCQRREMVAVRNSLGRTAVERGGGVVALIAGREFGEPLWEVGWVVVVQRRRAGEWAVVARSADGDPVWAGLTANLDAPIVLRTLAGCAPLIRATVHVGGDGLPVSEIARWDAPLRRKRSPQSAP